jgi:hypothetical protein
MRSIAAHLGSADSHDRLRFHPACPICRETRLTGGIPADALVSLRAQAVLTAGLFAVSATAPAATGVAAEPDQQQDGTVAVEHVAGDPANSADFDPGGNATGLPDTASAGSRTPAPAPAIDDESGPADQAPLVDPDDPVVDSGDDSGAAPAAPARGQSSATPLPATPTTPQAAPTAPAPPAGPNDDAATPAADTSGSTSNVDAVSLAPVVRSVANRSHGCQRPRGVRVRAPRIAAVDRQARSPVAAHASVAAPTAVASAEREPARGERAKPGDRLHTVLAGESLWAIASDVLGGDASPARVAREVQRLWRLNQDRIGTGDPDLLLIGTRLVLR